MIRAALIAMAVSIPLLSAADQRVASRAPLGTIAFPNSGNPAAQASFLSGVAWLHSFGYEDAIDAFRAAQKVDPQFVMAYWGEAMCFNQALWFHEDVAAGRAALAKLGATRELRAAKARTPREQAYLAAVEALYGTASPATASAQSKAARDRAYLDQMAALAAKFPTDDEAQVFHALAILAVLPRGDEALPLRQKAGTIAEGVFARNPKHPGAAHYILHAYDHPTLAARALPAARIYAQIAPAASHALHMPAHAFVQLGYWGEAAATDQASWDASVAWATRKGYSIALRDFHSLTWLQYELTQLGQFARATQTLALVDAALKVIKPAEDAGGHHYSDSEIGRGSGSMTLRNDRGSMRARYIIESERWAEMKGQGNFDNIDELFALGMASARLGDLDRAEATLKLFVDASGPAQDPGLREQAAVMAKEIEALIAFARGRQAEAFAAMDQATYLQGRMPKPIGRPYPVKGADELYGELLLAAGRAREAVGWFEKALVRTPNRSRAVLGLARAAAKAGDAAKSRVAYKQFLANWKNADAALPELKEARAALQ